MSKTDQFHHLWDEAHTMFHQDGIQQHEKHGLAVIRSVALALEYMEAPNKRRLWMTKECLRRAENELAALFALVEAIKGDD